MAHPLSKIEFTDILLGSTLPLHPYLTEHPRLSIRLVVDGTICGETPPVNGDLTSGLWDINSCLRASSVEQSVGLAVVASKKGLKIRFASMKLSAEELLTCIKAQSGGYQEFILVDASSSILLLMTCVVKASPSFMANTSPTLVDVYGNQIIDRHGREPQPNNSKHPFRDDLESLYPTAIRMPGWDDNKARALSALGNAYHRSYREGWRREDLDKAISLHEEAMQFTGPFHPQLAQHEYRLAMALMERFQQSGDQVDLEGAISHSETALKFTGDFDMDKPDVLCGLGCAFGVRFQHLGDLADIENSISYQRQAVDQTPDSHPHKPSMLSNLGNALQSRFQHLGSLADVEDAISGLQKAVDLTPDGHPEKPTWLKNLGGALQLRFDHLGSLPDVEDAIKYLRKAVDLTPDGNPDKPNQFNNLGLALKSRFKRLGSLADIEDAISGLRTAVDLTPDGRPGKPGLLSNLGIALQSRFKCLGDLSDMEDAISGFRRAVDLTPNGHPDKPSLLSNLGYALKSRFERLGSLADLEDAISILQKTLDLTPDGHPEKPGLFNNLGGALHCRFERFGTHADMEDGISATRKALGLTPEGHPSKPSLLNNLGGALQRRFECLGSLPDVEEAIKCLRKAIDLTPDGYSDKPRRLKNLGDALQSRFKHLGNLADMEDAISCFQKAADLTPDGRPDKAAWLCSIGNMLKVRFERLGSLTDMEDAISRLRRALDLTPDGHPDKPCYVTDLALALQSRFKHLGSLADIEDAISGFRKAMYLTPDSHPDKPSRFNNLGLALQSRFERLGSLSDIEDAISGFRKAVDLKPDEHPDKRTWLSNLGGALQHRFERFGRLADMEDAISILQKAVDLTPDGHPEKPTWLNNLGGALQRRSECLGSLPDIEDAISGLRAVVDLTPDGHHDKPGYLNNLGHAFLSRFRRLGQLSDLESALSSFSTAARSMNGSAMVRFEVARIWAKVAEEHSRSPLDAFSCAIELLPRIAWLGLAVTDQHALLTDVGGVVRDAVAAAIRYEEYETAVVWAEQGRSIVWQNLLGLRSPVDDLRQSHPLLAGRLQNIARQLEGSASDNALSAEGETVSPDDVPRGYSKLAIQWDNLVDEIRRLPSFGGFLKAKSFSQLAPAAHEGPVVILNVNKSQCDALVLISDDSSERHVSAVNIPLERFSYKTSEKLFKALTGLLKSAGVRERSERAIIIGGSQLDREAKFKKILRILWQDVVKPVIEGLAFQTKSGRPPRIWWCATGLLSFLPIHAAGLYGADEIEEKVSDYVVSSYTPTLTAILELSEPAVQDFQVLMVAQPSTPGAPPIPKTEDEVRLVHRLTAGARRMSLMNENATVERVREEMKESNWIHLACHGHQHPEDPMESGFLLHDKTLKLSDIVKMSLPKADFAFLSACQTAVGDEKVAEESVHLAAGMFLSGCRGVIATTWSIRDDDAPKIAEDVYSRIFKDGKPNRKEAAYALHEAVKRLRDSGAQCTAWVPFIHIGR